jgi:hypothetical protein
MRKFVDVPIYISGKGIAMLISLLLKTDLSGDKTSLTSLMMFLGRKPC